MESAKASFEMARLGPKDINVAEIQDTHSGDEVMHIEEVGLCAPEEGGRLVDKGATEIGGRIPVNTGGGLISCGEALRASGLRQLYEIVLHSGGMQGQGR
jgi:acetyl-CoA acetyltransferase